MEALGSNDLIKGVGDLVVAVVKEELDLECSVLEVPGEVTGLLGRPRPRWGGR